VAIVVIGVALAAFTTVGAALLVAALGAALIAGVIRRLRGGTAPETKTSAARRAADVTIDAEVVEPPEGEGDRPPKRLE
jgi:membrane protein implicated in regulation of membrane protease activity